MKYQQLASCLVLSILFGSVLHSANPDNTDLDGSWKLISTQAEGKSEDSIDDDEVLKIQGGDFVITRKSVQVGAGNIVLNRSKKPAWINIKTDSIERFGVFRIEADYLTISIIKGPNDDKSRPADFDTKKDDMRVKYVYKKKS